MNKTLLGAVSLLAIVSANPAEATVTLIAGDTTTNLNAGQSTTVYFNGISDDNVISGLTSSLMLTLISQTSSLSTFGYTLYNTSSSPITDSRVSVFGFDVEPNTTLATVLTGGVFTGTGSGSIANGRSVELCFTAGPNCAGGSGDGVLQGANASGTFSLAFAGNGSNITLLNFADRYQSIAGAGNVTSATGSSVGAVPEPGTWAMMLLGFGAMGVVLRRRTRRLPGLCQAA